jgi:ATP-dependent DNA helicase RecQ
MLVVQRTGWGKSLVYFLATRLLRDQGAGPTLLISPLLALMRNQIAAAERIGVRAASMNSENPEEWGEIKRRIRLGAVDVLLISPERLANEQFRQEVLLPVAPRIGLFVVDEAHCISDWGHDFRPDYRRIARVIQALPRPVPVLATTATASERVVADVVAQLRIPLRVLRGPLVRTSLRLQTMHMPSAATRLGWLAEQVPMIPGSGIIYALTVRDTKQVAEWLQSQAIDAHAYSGSTPSEERSALEERLLRNEVKALVATSALGMGFDKPDLGFVVHFQRPASVVHYYQQVGRAGRALAEAYGILLSGSEDAEIADYFIRTAFPPEAHVEAILTALEKAVAGLTLTEIEREVNLTRGQLEKALKILSTDTPAAVGKLGSRWVRNPVRYIVDRKKVAQLCRLRREEQHRMDLYVRSEQCLMEFLARELSDPHAAACGRCSVCVGKPLVPIGCSPQRVEAAERFLRRCVHPIEPRSRWPGDALASRGWSGQIPEHLRAAPGYALSHWGDAGYGPLVRRGKLIEERLPDELVERAREWVRTWRPEPAPTWITCVPSTRHPGLVRDFTLRLARALGLRFVDCIISLGSAEPQKNMQNSYQQAKNIANVFRVQRWPGISGPVLLVDDTVDSRWTFTVLAVQLRAAGSGKVFPLALASTAGRDA